MKPTFLVIIALWLISPSTFSQDSASTPLLYTRVEQVDSAFKRAELYTRARAWFAETYRSAKEVIQMDDKESGKIIGKGNIRYTSSIFSGSEGTKGWISYTITLQVKDGRYKYDVTDFYHEGNPLNTAGQFSFRLITNAKECPYKIGIFMTKGWRNKVWTDIKNTIDKNTLSLIISLKSAMNKPAKKDSDW